MCASIISRSNNIRPAQQVALKLTTQGWLMQVNLSISKQMKLTIIGDIDVKQTMNKAAKNNQLEQQGTARHGANASKSVNKQANEANHNR